MTAASKHPEAHDNGAQTPEGYRPVTVCPTRTPELHELGEFPMTCYRCHIEADS